ncbi:nucleotide exchange factor GrpE [Oculatella sp. LEGE 06141]|uniref:nucleotide exchange factor GrpE n=1 Tax=Oculatella sp. LEGE 06141 TaxID=1828648 RepID=UPI00188305E8|nr:nucleotide exchange factor GrpE [Oculatella sp. LEGE 06141]MBE9177038.1 nucleotide exchange factor GrpE [Oculatella sp. LEGE 06141]
MTEEEKQLENTQEPVVEATSETVEETMSETTPSSDVGISGESAGADFSDAWKALDAEADDTVAAPDGADSGSETVTNQAALSEMSQMVESLKAQLEDRTGQYVRIAADFDNFRKRTQKEKEDLEQQVKCSTIVELLPVVDNFERARSQIKPQTDAEMNIHKSYQGIYKQLVDCLKRIGVGPMRSEGKEFDPNLHEAIMREATDEYPEGTVIEELVRGYLLGERVLRHAMVKVAAAPEPASAPDDENPSSSES